MVAAIFIALGGDGVAEAVPDHDHFFDNVLKAMAETPNDSEYGKHAVHGCGVCHHLGDGLSLLSVVVPIATSLRYELSNDRVSSRALEPPFQPPIEVSA